MKIKYKWIKIQNLRYKELNENQIYYQFQSKDKIETVVLNLLNYLNPIRKLKEGGPK